MVRQLARHGYANESYRELVPMLERVIRHQGFHEWWSVGNEPKGSGKFRGSAGVLIDAIHELRELAKKQLEERPSERDKTRAETVLIRPLRPEERDLRPLA